ncbi:MAG: cob(I)yrinic acid a,c-diamide adenosyltransferase [Candidatus Glassbacteria bacterium RBG_16_58_8]|uniref:Cob(I)yrinic acid a,c-diamide adenosyltransferase n=1 Tax=Candidatus Glassbacteria bacterium RBG_16_58_8 TaxID=1817866 RepID=A0A1F5YCC3_9BACT|nr:MAG: cob(I)yrinic acid a,c-diamide adenosyltransferase [Candidatus Glassbacteria bacterium RBG_16_58_8]
MVIVYTGGGKGKTTAALGLALRAWGYGWKTLFVQFIKGTWHYGELEAARRLHPSVEIRPMGVGFVHIMGDQLPLEEHREAARKALSAVREEIASERWDIIVLDEINVAISERLLTAEEVLEVVSSRPAWMSLVLTGRNAPGPLVEAADLVTEMREVKHPFRQGIEAQQGIDY